MALNLLKKYSDLLELIHLENHHRTTSLYEIFKRDIEDNNSFLFKGKQIWPVKRDGVDTMQTLFNHLIKKESYDEKGKKTGARVFDMSRSQRLHWIRNHIEEKCPSLEIFSYKDRINGKDKIRTYIYDKTHEYVIILEPLKTELDYYLLTAYPVDKITGKEQIKNKIKKRLPDLY